MAEIKYQYAYDENQHLISIAEVTKENRNQHQYVCIGCGNPLLPRAIGSKCRRPHFYHKQMVDCSGETYLHKLTKRIFKERFDKAEHFEITYPVTRECSASNCALRNKKCKEEYSTTTIDLKQYYDTCQEEMPIDGFIADLLLTSSTDTHIPPILIEVCVSHACEPEKRASGLKIIEMKIRNEDDIKELLGGNHLTEERGWEYEHKKSGTVEFISFKRTLKERMNVPIVRYVLGDDDDHQAGYCTFVNCSKSQYKIRNDSRWEFNIVGQHDELPFTQIALHRLYKSCNVRRCTVCRFYYATMYEEYPICRLSKKYGTPKIPHMKDAEKCRSFSIGALDLGWNFRNEKVCIMEIGDIAPNKKEPFKVIVAGSSGFRNYDLFKEKCDYFLYSKIHLSEVSILLGTARATGEMIVRYCVEQGITFEPFDAEWERYGQGAPRQCTDSMLKYADAAIVFWDGESTHTKYIIDAAKRKGIKVAVIKVDVEPGSQMYLNL